MATLNEIADKILGRLDRRFDDISRDEMKFAVKYWRATLIRQDIERNSDNPLYLQSIQMELIKVDKYDPCALIVDCPVLRTKDKVPMPIRLKDGRLFKFVGEAGRRKSWTYTNTEDLIYTMSNKWTADIIRYNWTNGYLYVFNNTLYKIVEAEAAWAKPEEINICATEQTCYSDDDPFPLPDDMIVTIVEGIVKGELPVKASELETKHEGK